MGASTLGGYLRDVERFFCLVRMSGFVLSPRDVEKVREWYLAGVPMHVVIEGIIQGAREFSWTAARGERLPHNISFYSKFIAARVRAFRRRGSEASSATTGHQATPVSQGALDSSQKSSPLVKEVLTHLISELELLILQEERPTERDVKCRILNALAALRDRALQIDEDSLPFELQRLDDEYLAFYDSALREEERAELDRMTEAALSAEKGISRKALEGRRRVIRAKLLRSRLNIMEFVK